MIEWALYLGVILIVVYYWLTWNYDHWMKMNVPFIEPQLLFGNIKDILFFRKSQGVLYEELYRRSDAPALGLYKMRQPQLLIRDPGFIKLLTINEFQNFRENDIYTEPNDFFLTTNVFFFGGEEWKRKRATITPALTVSKMKQFVPHMVEISRDMIKFLEDKTDQPLEAREFTKLFTVETAMSYVYGVKCDSYREPNSKYKKVFDEIFDPNWVTALKLTISNIFPSVGRVFRFGLTPKNFVEFYTNVVGEMIEYKKKNKVTRKDFLQFMIDNNGKDGNPELSVYDITGLTMNIAADGTETTGTALTLITDCLIRYPDHQRKLIEEIDKKINSMDDITYENINSINYLEAFILESLRLLPPALLLEKKCTNDCEVTYEGKTFRFRKDDKVAYCMYANHMDPKYFPNPRDFQPERFINNDDILGYAPFGYGPRACLGRPFAKIQMKVYLCALLKNFTLHPKGPLTKVEIDPRSPILFIIKGGVWFKARKR